MALPEIAEESDRALLWEEKKMDLCFDRLSLGCRRVTWQCCPASHWRSGFRVLGCSYRWRSIFFGTVTAALSIGKEAGGRRGWEEVGAGGSGWEQSHLLEDSGRKS